MIQISASELCRILSANETSLNIIELAIRKALEKVYSSSELDALREQACLSDAIAQYEINRKGQARRL